MARIHLVPQPHPPALRAAPMSHSTIREGVRLGLIVGAATWLWVAGFDYFMGEPFQTFQFLGGLAAFTVIHLALCLAYGITVISAVHASMKEPTVIYAVIFCAILFQFAVVGATAMLANIGIGQLAWGKFLAGNAVTACLTFVLISRNHPLIDLFHAAGAHQEEHPPSR